MRDIAKLLLPVLLIAVQLYVYIHFVRKYW
jgi:hypothetical protein